MQEYPFSFLFSIPHFSVGCISGLYYILSFMIQQDTVFPSLHHFSLVSTRNDKEKRVVFLDMGPEKSTLYCRLPDGFDILYKEQAREVVCPYSNEHACLSLFSAIEKETSQRYPRLAKLFHILIKELPQDCLFCLHRKKSIQQILDLFPNKNISYRAIELFLRSPIKKDANVVKILETHVSAIDIIFHQIRYPELQDDFLQMLYDTIQELILNCDIHNEEEREHAARQFKMSILNKIDQLSLYVHVRKIDFTRWFLSLVYFQSLQQDISSNNTLALSLIKKAMFLLQLYFNTEHEHPLDETTQFLLQDASGHRSLIQIPSHTLNRIHPLFRGEYIKV